MQSGKAEAALKQVLRTRGVAVCENERLTEALLRDYCPDDRSAVNCLMMALREDIPQSILDAASGANLQSLRGSLSEKLRKACRMEQTSADWTVTAWMSALNRPCPLPEGEGPKLSPPITPVDPVRRPPPPEPPEKKSAPPPPLKNQAGKEPAKWGEAVGLAILKVIIVGIVAFFVIYGIFYLLGHFVGPGLASISHGGAVDVIIGVIGVLIGATFIGKAIKFLIEAVKEPKERLF